MTIDAWLQSSIADATRRRLPELTPLLEALAQATRALRSADFNVDPTSQAGTHAGQPGDESRP